MLHRGSSDWRCCSVNISVRIDGIDEVVSKLNDMASGARMQRALAAAGEVVRADAAANCPVDTGRLAGSIVCNVDGNSALIGPTAEYGVYVEFGTGSKGSPEVAHTSKKTWTYYKGGRFYTTSGQAPQPFLVPALKNNVAEIAAKFKEAYSNG